MKAFLTNPAKKKQYFLLFADSLIIFSVFIFAYIFRIVFYEGGDISLLRERLTWLMFLAVILHLLSFYVFDLYNYNTKRDNPSLFLLISIAVVFAVGCIAIASYAFPKAKLGRVLLVFHVPVLIIVFFFWRKASYLFLKGFPGNNLLIVGTTSEDSGLNIEKKVGTEYNLVGVISNIYDQSSAISLNNHEYKGGIQELVQKESISTILVTTSLRKSPAIKNELINLKFQGIEILDLPTFISKLSAKVPVEVTGDEWLLFSHQNRSLKPAFYLKIKRVIDLIGSLIGLIFSFPIFLILALIVKLTSKGPVFFKQERLGLSEEPFTLFKFRTMVDNAEKTTGPKWSSKDDPRITAVGSFLRKTRLDELPQLINILKGDMSFVGPRPIRRFFAKQFSDAFPYYRLRFMVKPGITGWAQVMGGYAGSVEGQLEKLEYELFYIQNQSFILDLIIFLKTIQTILFSRGQ